MQQEVFSLPISLIFFTFFFVMMLTGVVRSHLIKQSIMDIPNDRSMHVIPVPRGGGLAIMLVILPSMIGAAYWLDVMGTQMIVIAAAIMLCFISWLDDRRPVSSGVRLAFHLFAAGLGCMAFQPSALLFDGLLPFWADRAVMIIGWAWFINLYNFMDGIDGITATQTIAIMTGLCFVTLAADLENDYLHFMAIVMTGACLGFLAHNWHPAKIFLGDIGSVALGYLTGFAMLTLALHGEKAAAFILPLYYLADSGITITRRALRGEKIWQPHREHFYQKAAMGLKCHDKVVVDILMGNVALIFAATLSVTHPWHGLVSGVLIVAIVLQKLHISAYKKPLRIKDQ